MNINNLLSVSIIIPTLDADKFLENCLLSVTKQDYPREKVEIIVSDGGSTDRTLKIARKYQCRIVVNKKVLAEPGVDLGLKEAKNGIRFILAADNELIGENWIKNMVKPFLNPKIYAAFPKQVSASSDNWLTKYDNTFTDSFNHFVYGNAANTRTFHKIYKTLDKTKDYIVFEFTPEEHPIIALAQGFAIRRNFQRPEGMEYDDILPIIKMITERKKIAYVPAALLCHHTTRNLKHFIKKQKWAIDNALSGKKYGVSGRKKYLSLKRKIKMYIWPFYAVSFIFPLINSLKGLIIDKEKYWIYHSFISFIFAVIFWKEFISIKILRKKIPSLGETLNL